MMREKRKLSSAAVVLISVLAVIVLALSYLQFIDGPLNEQTEEAEMQLENAKQEYEIARAELEKLQIIKEQLKNRKASGLLYMPSYNSIKHEISTLNRIFKGTRDYAIELSDPILDRKMVRRNATIRFSAKDYEKAAAIINRITKCGVRNNILNISCANSVDEESVSQIVLNITFYETMFGGKADSGLVVPSRQEEEPEESTV